MKCIACGDLFYGPRMLCPGCHKSAGERKADGRWLGGRKAWATPGHTDLMVPPESIEVEK